MHKTFITWFISIIAVVFIGCAHAGLVCNSDGSICGPNEDALAASVHLPRDDRPTIEHVVSEEYAAFAPLRGRTWECWGIHVFFAKLGFGKYDGPIFIRAVATGNRKKDVQADIVVEMMRILDTYVAAKQIKNDAIIEAPGHLPDVPGAGPASRVRCWHDKRPREHQRDWRETRDWPAATFVAPKELPASVNWSPNGPLPAPRGTMVDTRETVMCKGAILYHVREGEDLHTNEKHVEDAHERPGPRTWAMSRLREELLAIPKAHSARLNNGNENKFTLLTVPLDCWTPGAKPTAPIGWQILQREYPTIKW